METLRDKIAAQLRRCAQCGHEWLKKPHAPEPARCPNHACRSKRWAENQAGDKIKLREPHYEPID
jgi:hypothetical protein